MPSDKAFDNEREFARRERELSERIAELEETARRLTHEIEARRQDAARLDRSHDHGRVWAGLQTILDGFAIFDEDHRLVLANQAYLSVLNGVTEVAPGITYDRLCEIFGRGRDRGDAARRANVVRLDEGPLAAGGDPARDPAPF